MDYIKSIDFVSEDMNNLELNNFPLSLQNETHMHVHFPLKKSYNAIKYKHTFDYLLTALDNLFQRARALSIIFWQLQWTNRFTAFFLSQRFRKSVQPVSNH